MGFFSRLFGKKKKEESTYPTVSFPIIKVTPEPVVLDTKTSEEELKPIVAKSANKKIVVKPATKPATKPAKPVTKPAPVVKTAPVESKTKSKPIIKKK